MFKHLFASMNELLDEVMSQYPSSTGSKQKELQAQIQSLKTMSDTCIEEWLLFEEKLGKFMQAFGGSPLFSAGPELHHLETPAGKCDRFLLGEGYYKLHMFDAALASFAELVRQRPECSLSRIYLAMCYLRQGNYDESYYHFQFLSRLSDNVQIKAISYNAMGCIQAGNRNMDKALDYFNLAYRTDPASVQPLIEAGLCREAKEGLIFPFQTRLAASLAGTAKV